MKRFILTALAALLLAGNADAATTWNMLCPAGSNTYGNKSGTTTYTANSTGLVTGVASTDSNALTDQGCVPLNQNAASGGVAFSQTTTGNPLVETYVGSVITASINAAGGYTFIPGTTGKTLYPANLTLTASGTAATATSVEVLCTSGNVLGTFPIADLVNAIPANVFAPYTSVTMPGTIAGTAFAKGCASGDGIIISNVGSNLSTTTLIWINLTYAIQNK